MSAPPLAAALFDLDGTLLDTAPDLCRIANALRAELGLAPLPLAQIRPLVSHGSTPVLRAALPNLPAEQFEALRQRFLDEYAAHPAVHTRLFEGFEHVLSRLEQHRIPWGVITNKPQRHTDPLLRALGLDTRAAVVLAGDSLPRAKPDPLPLVTAASRLGLAPPRCLYLGDALRDAQAARAAGMVSLGARFGYIDQADAPHCWPVDAWIDRPIELLDWLGLARS